MLTHKTQQTSHPFSCLCLSSASSSSFSSALLCNTTPLLFLLTTSAVKSHIFSSLRKLYHILSHSHIAVSSTTASPTYIHTFYLSQPPAFVASEGRGRERESKPTHSCQNYVKLPPNQNVVSDAELGWNFISSTLEPPLSFLPSVASTIPPSARLPLSNRIHTHTDHNGSSSNQKRPSFAFVAFGG